MLIGVPKEIKPQEYRVGLTPASVAALISAGHLVILETGAGFGSGFSDEDYKKAVAEIVPDAASLFERAEMIVKVKEPQPRECQMLREGQVLVAYLHLAPDRQLSRLLLSSQATCVAYETITDQGGRLPLLTPMSQVAGRVAVQEGAHHLGKPRGGRGILMSGVEGVEPAQVLVFGGGVVGENAMQVALGMGARVTVLDKSEKRLEALGKIYGERARFECSTNEQISRHLAQADLVIGAVLMPGGKAPVVVRREHLDLMQKGAVMVDVAIDQGGCFETSRPTTHSEPTFIVDGIVHYCVTNMPSSVPRTATLALNRATLPYILKISSGAVEAMLEDEYLRNGLNVHMGKITSEVIAHEQDLPYVPALSALGGF